MADAIIGVLQATSPDRLLDVEQLTVGANTVVRERNRVAGAAAAELADVRNTVPGTTDYGLAVRQVDNTVKAASTAAVAADKALVVAISPNNSVAVTAASLPLPTGAATAANQTTLGSQTTKINDGTNTAAVKAASTAALTTDPALVTTISPNLPQVAATGTISTAASTTVLISLLGMSSLTLHLDFEAPGGVGTIEFLGLSTVASLTTSTILYGRHLDALSDEVSFVATATSSWEFDVSGFVQFGISVTGPVSGSVTYVMRTGMSGGHVTLASSLPPGTNIIGAVNITDSTNTASVKAASTAAVAADKALVVAISPNNTVPVSAASLPLPTGAATAANQTTLGNQTTKINDGTRTTTIKAASTAAVAADTALVVAISPNNTVPVSAASLPLPTGAATATNQTTLNTQTTLINDGTRTAVIKAASTAAVAADPALVVAISPNNTVPVSAASLPLPTGAATAANQTTENATLSTISGQLPATLGQKAMAASEAVVIASDQSTIPVQGAKTNNNAAPGATNIGVLDALANAAAPAWTEGNQALLSVDLVGNLRVREPESNLAVTATAAVNTAVTATLPAAGAGLFHYITGFELVKLYSVAGVANGAGIIVTSTNLPGNPAWTTEQIAGSGAVAGPGACVTVIGRSELNRPLKSSVANTATTFVAPAQLQTIWRWNVTYYTAP